MPDEADDEPAPPEPVELVGAGSKPFMIGIDCMMGMGIGGGGGDDDDDVGCGSG